MAGGSVAHYQPGTLTPVDTYQDPALSIANPNPITLDANGEAIIWGKDSTSYRQIVKDAQCNLVWDQVTTIGGFTSPMNSLGDLVVGGAGGTPTRLGVGAPGQVVASNGSTPVYATLTASSVGADPVGTAAALPGIGGQATLVLSGYPIAAGAGVITVSASAPSGTPVDGQLWFQHA